MTRFIDENFIFYCRKSYKQIENFNFWKIVPNFCEVYNCWTCDWIIQPQRYEIGVIVLIFAFSDMSSYFTQQILIVDKIVWRAPRHRLFKAHALLKIEVQIIRNIEKYQFEYLKLTIVAPLKKPWLYQCFKFSRRTKDILAYLLYLVWNYNYNFQVLSRKGHI